MLVKLEKGGSHDVRGQTAEGATTRWKRFKPVSPRVKPQLYINEYVCLIRFILKVYALASGP